MIEIEIHGTKRFEVVEQKTIVPIHTPSLEDTAENIDYCMNCPLPDCKYDSVEQCKLYDRKPKREYAQAKKDTWAYSYWKHDK